MIKLWQKKVFVSCFTHREHESYFFWKTYSKDDLFGVMISLNPNFFSSLTIHTDEKCEDEPLYPCDRTVPKVVFSPNISTESCGVYDFSFVDVIYLPRNQKLEGIKHHQGRFKYVEWDAEEETRLRVAIRPKCLEFSAEASELKYLTPSTEYIYAKLTDICLENMIITLSPFASNDLKEKVERLLQEIIL